MQVTITLPDELLLLVEKAAVESCITLSKFVEKALDDALAMPRGNRPRREFKMSPSDGGGVFPGVNLDDSAALQDIMDPPEEIRKKFMG